MVLCNFINNRIIKIYINTKLYNENFELLGMIFSGHNVESCICDFDPQCSILIYDSYNSSETYMNEYHFLYICPLNFKADGWFFNLMAMLEQHYADILKCTVLHGSCFSIGKKNIILLGDRKSGKSTLTKLLIDRRSATYLDEDAIFLVGEKIYGLNFPICLRQIAENDRNPLSLVVDCDGELRYIYIPSDKTSFFDRIDVLLFPHFNNEIEHIHYDISTGSLGAIIKNVKKSYTIKGLYNDIATHFKSTKAYDIHYSNSESAILAIDKILGMETIDAD